MAEILQKVKAVVISDTHLGTRACKAKKLLHYLKSIHPEILVLNGDIIDAWRFNKNFFPKSHLKVLRQLLKMMEKGVKVVYITGNHDEMMRKFSGLKLDNFEIANQYCLNLDGNKTWIFHGDILDFLIHHTKWLARFGAFTYGLLSVVNNNINAIRNKLGKGEFYIYRSFRERIKGNQKTLSRLEETIAKMAIEQYYNTVIIGHTHFPNEKRFSNEHGSILYLNSGDWVENFTSVEYYDGKWQLRYLHHNSEKEETDEGELFIPSDKELFQIILKEFGMKSMPKNNRVDKNTK